MVGSLRELRIIMVNENEGSDLLSVEYRSQRNTEFPRFRRFRAASRFTLSQRGTATVLRISIIGTIMPDARQRDSYPFPSSVDEGDLQRRPC